MELEERLKNNDRSRFQKAQTNQFLRLLDKKYSKVLEVGCGKGFWSYVGLKYGKFKKCFGCDVFNDYKLKAEYKKITGKVLPYKDNQFDLVFSMDVVEHLEDDLFFIKEHLRLVKKGGTIIVGTPNYWRITNILLMILGRLKYPRNMGPDTYGDCIHLREYKKKELISLITKAGGSEIKIYPCWLGILALSLGIEKLPFFLKPFCHFWFIKFKKYD